MPELKLPKLPKRTPVKLTVTIPPELKKALDDYAAAYEAAYGDSESVANLVPYMLEAFIVSDKGFARSRPRS